MALLKIFESKRLLEQILLNESQQGGLNVSGKLDLTDMPNYSSVYTSGEPYRLEFQMCVSQTDQETLSLSIRCFPGEMPKDQRWPVVVKWKVSVINERTRESLDFNTITTTVTKQSIETPDGHLGQDLPIRLTQIKDFITKKSIVLRWNVKLSTQANTFSPDQKSFQSCDQPNIKEHIETALSLTKNIGETFNTVQYQEQITALLSQKLSPSSEAFMGIASMTTRINTADERIDNLLDSFSKENCKATQCMSVREDDDNNHALESADSKTSGSLNFLLFGESKGGKSATGNSILLKSVFKTGPQRTSFIKPIVGASQITLPNITALVTVVETHDNLKNTDKCQIFDICPEGFDSILYVMNYNKLYENRFNKNKFFSSWKKNSSFSIEALKNFGILLLTGGDCFELDHQNQDFQTQFGEWGSDFHHLENAVQGRVIFFNNTTTSEEKKNEQLTKLLKIVQSLPNRPKRFCKEAYIKCEMTSLKSSLCDQHLLKNYTNINSIISKFLLKQFIDIQLKNNLQFIKNTAQRIQDNKRSNDRSDSSRSKQFNRFEFNIMVLGNRTKSVDEFIIQTGSMGLHNQSRPMYLPLYPEEASTYSAIMLLISCSKLSPEEEHIIREFINLEAVRFKTKFILVVTDVDSEKLKVSESEFIEMCRNETEVFNQVYDFCLGKAILFDLKTDDVIRRLQQEASLMNILLQLDSGPKELMARREILLPYFFEPSVYKRSLTSITSDNNPETKRGAFLNRKYPVTSTTSRDPWKIKEKDK